MKEKWFMRKLICWIQILGLSYQRITDFLLGSSVLLFVLLGYFLHPTFYFLIQFQAVYLIYSGVTNVCIISNAFKKIGFLEKEYLKNYNHN